MRKKLFQLLLFISCLGLLAEGVALSLNPIQSTVLSVHGGKIYLSCQFDSFKTDCLLDSGSSFSTVNSEVFDNYQANGHIKYNGGTGNEIIADKIDIHELKTAQLRLNNWPVARLPHQSGYLSIIGLDVFSKSSVLFDFQKLKIILEPPIDNKLAASAFTLAFGLILLPVKIGDFFLLAAWDTGASTTVIDQDYISSHPSEFSFIKEVQGTDATRTDMPMKLYRVNSLEIDKIVLKNVLVVAMDFSEMRKIHPHFPVFFLGYNVLIDHCWYFDFAKQRWKLD